MHIIGLTGAIAMGKTTTADFFRRLGVPVFDADKVVHTMYQPGGAAISVLQDLFPEVIQDQTIDKSLLGQIVWGEPKALSLLESAIHPLLFREKDRFIKQVRLKRPPYIVLDVPLLFETRLDLVCHRVICVQAPKFIQDQRLRIRKGMTQDKRIAIRRRQFKNQSVQNLSDFSIQTGLGRAYTQKKVKQLDRLIRKPPTSLPSGCAGKLKPDTGRRIFFLRSVKKVKHNARNCS